MGHGGMSCGMKTIRLTMVLFNVVFFLAGAALLASGIYFMVDPQFQKLKELFQMNPDIEKGLSYLEMIWIVLIVLGSTLLIIGFLGCCGAMRQVKLFLTCYAFIIGVIIIFEVAMATYFIAFQGKFQNRFAPELQQRLKNTYEGPLVPKPSPISLAMDLVMYNFECCGVMGKSDFNETKKWDRTDPSLTSNKFRYPLTCCPMGKAPGNWKGFTVEELQKAAHCARTGVNINEKGCYDKLVDLLNSTKTWVIVVAVLILAIELLTFIFTLALCCRRKKDTLYYSS